ncbi:MAG: DUF6529 family protein [Solirubrobacterales bacterium]
MEGFFETITRGNVTEVKVVLASVVMALAGYQVFLMAIGYGKLRLRFLEPAPATRAHRAIGGTIVVVSLLVAAMCLAYFELDEAAVHAVVASALLAVLALKLVRGPLVAFGGPLPPAARDHRVRPLRPHLADLRRRLPLRLMDERSRTRQLIGSLLAAVAIVAVVVVAVTARLGSTSVAELDAREEALEQRQEAQEEQLEARQERREERLGN